MTMAVSVLSEVNPVVWSTVALLPVVYILYHSVRLLLAHLQTRRALAKIPHLPNLHWFWGHLHLSSTPDEKGLAFFREVSRKFRRISSTWIGPVFGVIGLHHPETVKEMLKTTEPKPLKMGIYGLGLQWLGKGLLLGSGNRWARTRRLLTPAFHFELLKPYAQVFNDTADTLLEKLDEHADQGTSFDAFKFTSAHTFDNLLRCICSYNTDVQRQGNENKYLKAVVDLAEAWTYRSFRPWFFPEFIWRLTPRGREFAKNCDYVHQFAEEMIRKRMKLLEEEKASGEKRTRYTDFLDRLIEARDEDGRGLTLDEIRNEMDTFFFAGHDTTSSALSWTLYELARHEEQQERCRSEIARVMRDEAQFAWENIRAIPYTTQCIKEALRLHTPVPFIIRQPENDMHIGGYRIPRGVQVQVSLYFLHHNEDVWTDPQTYDPDRFSPDNVAKMSSHDFLPFSAGPRNCIGQHFALNEIKVTVARILQRFRVEVDESVEVKHAFSLVMRTENGMFLKVKRL